MPSAFDPAPTLPGWNYDYETGAWPAGDDAWFRSIFDLRLYNLFVDALNERINARDSSSDGFLPHAASGDYSLASWADLQAKAQQVSQSMLDGYDDSGTAYDYSTPFADVIDFAFPVPAPFRRRFPREILALDAAGSEGWNARFAGGTGANGKVYTYASGAWGLAAAGTAPDVLDAVWADDGSFDVASGTYPTSGDYFGPWILSDLRDLINRMVVTGQTTEDGVYAGSQLGLDSHGENCSNSGDDEAAYNSGENCSTVTGLYAIDGGGDGVTTHHGPFARACGYIKMTGYNPAFARDLLFFSYGDSNNNFNNFGDAVAFHQYERVHASATPISSADYDGPRIGSLDIPIGTGDQADDYASIPVPGGPAGLWIVLFERWDVAGGFTYTKYT